MTTSLPDSLNEAVASPSDNAVSKDLPFRTPPNFADLASIIWGYTWKTLPLWSFAATFLFWRYLQLVGRPELFLQSISNAAGLGTFLFGFIFLISVVIICLALPSLYFGMAFSGRVHDQDEQLARIFPLVLIRLSFGVFLGLLLTFKWPTAGIPIGVSLGVVLNAVWLSAKDNERLIEALGGAQESKQSRFWWALLYSFALWIGGFILVLPSALVFKVLPFSDGEWWSPIFSLLLIWSVVLSTLVPALLYFVTKANKRTRWGPKIAFMGGLFAPVYLIFFIYSTSATERLLETAASAIGIRTETAYKYRVASNRFEADQFDELLWDAKKMTFSFSVTAISPLALGDLIVLCPSSHANPDVMKNKASSECVVFKQDEVARFPKRPERESNHP